jgi:hypothetical protein
MNINADVKDVNVKKHEKTGFGVEMEGVFYS